MAFATTPLTKKRSPTWELDRETPAEKPPLRRRRRSNDDHRHHDFNPFDFDSDSDVTIPVTIDFDDYNTGLDDDDDDDGSDDYTGPNDLIVQSINRERLELEIVASAIVDSLKPCWGEFSRFLAPILVSEFPVEIGTELQSRLLEMSEGHIIDVLSNFNPPLVDVSEISARRIISYVRITGEI